RSSPASGGGGRKSRGGVPRRADEAALDVGGAGGFRALRRVAPAAAAAGFDDEDVAGTDDDADLLGLDGAAPVARAQDVAVRLAVLAAEDAAGTVADAVARGVAERRLGDLDDHLEVAAGAAAELAVAAGIGAAFVAAEEEREAHFGDFQAAELDAARRLPLAAARPAIARRRGAAARSGLEEMPDELATVARVLTRDGYAEAAAPAGHGAVGAGWSQRGDDRLDDLLAAMIGGERHRRAFVGPDDRPRLGDHLERAEG